MTSPMKTNATRRARQFDFTKCKQRYIALKILYFGWDLDGLSTQVDNENTVEYHLFQALTKTCLVESREKCQYNRCGRTDKGVSSYGQVVNLTVRSALIDENDPKNIGLFTPENYMEDTNNVKNNQNQIELNYIDMLNRVLPEEVKVIAWAPVDSQFSSRFNCRSRSYAYVFPVGNLSLESMTEALNYIVGDHDFRNLCSFDLKNGVTSHHRRIISASLEPVRCIDDVDNAKNPTEGYQFYQIVIIGQAFLYHQIRCIMTILFLIGERKERPDVIRDLLDIERCPARPNYNRADPLPLSLFDCDYEESKLPLGWIHTRSSLHNLTKQIRFLWYRFKTKTLLIEKVLMDLDEKDRKMLDASSSRLASESKQTIAWKDFGLKCDNMCESKYVPLLKRPRDETLEEKLLALDQKHKTS